MRWRVAQINEIKFDYECCVPYGFVEVIAQETGLGILIVDKTTQDEVDMNKLPLRDQGNIKRQVRDWANYYRDMKEFGGRHPAEQDTSKSFVDWINGGSK